MKQCYHTECDSWSQDLATKDKYKFMASTVQSLVLTIAEMSMEGHESSCILDTVQHIIKQASSVDLINAIKTTTQATKQRYVC